MTSAVGACVCLAGGQMHLAIGDHVEMVACGDRHSGRRGVLIDFEASTEAPAWRPRALVAFDQGIEGAIPQKNLRSVGTLPSAPSSAKFTDKLHREVYQGLRDVFFAVEVFFPPSSSLVLPPSSFLQSAVTLP